MTNVPMQDASIDIFNMKYGQGSTLEEVKARVAGALAAIEGNFDDWYPQFSWAMDNGAIPAGRIMANAGRSERIRTSTINCVVSGTIDDNMESILHKLYEAGLSLKAGCGVGYDFSNIRPHGANVGGVQAHASGPISFMDLYDTLCATISSAGDRRGAQMATLSISHPDVAKFIEAKRTDGKLRHFNLSLLVHTHYNLDGPLWDKVMRSAYDYAEPGVLFIDEINRMNNNWWFENITATNPCGEQPLPPFGSCLLGSIDLTRFITRNGAVTGFDWQRFEEVVRIFTRMLDNVVEINNLPLAEQRRELARTRRHGMGFLGLGSALNLLNIPYGSQASFDFTEELCKTLALIGWATSLELAKEKGPAPIMKEEFVLSTDLANRRPEMLKDGHRIGDRLKGKTFFKYSKYMQRIGRENPRLVQELSRVGSRFSHHTSIAPTGTISLAFANNASNGIEPSFSHEYIRNVIRPGRATKESMRVYSAEKLRGSKLLIESGDLTPDDHLYIMSAAQPWIDSSISKTINVPTNYDYNSFKKIYSTAKSMGLKGCTVFRYNPEAFQGVLVRPEDAASTEYEFTTQSGKRYRAKGDQMIQYDGSTHTAANLYEAIKEGKYGRY